MDCNVESSVLLSALAILVLIYGMWIAVCDKNHFFVLKPRFAREATG